MWYLAALQWKNGESEWVTHRALEADGDKNALKTAEEYVATMWGIVAEKDGDWSVAPPGYPAVRVQGVFAVNSLDDVVKVIGRIGVGGKNEKE